MLAQAVSMFRVGIVCLGSAFILLLKPLLEFATWKTNQPVDVDMGDLPPEDPATECALLDPPPAAHLGDTQQFLHRGVC